MGAIRRLASNLQMGLHSNPSGNNTRHFCRMISVKIIYKLIYFPHNIFEPRVTTLHPASDFLVIGQPADILHKYLYYAECGYTASSVTGWCPVVVDGVSGDSVYDARHRPALTGHIVRPPPDTPSGHHRTVSGHTGHSPVGTGHGRKMADTTGHGPQHAGQRPLLPTARHNDYFEFHC